MKNLSVFSPKLFFFIFVFLKKTRQCIYSPICLVLTIINRKMIPGKLPGPIDLAAAQALCIHETTKIVLISNHKDFVFAAF